MNEIVEEIKRMDKIHDEWSHRRLVSLFSKIIQAPNSLNDQTVILQPACPICKKLWNRKAWRYDPLNVNLTETRIQAWISSIMARHFRKVHGFDMKKTPYSGWATDPGYYFCPRCEEYISGLLHAIAHWLNEVKELPQSVRFALASHNLEVGI